MKRAASTKKGACRKEAEVIVLHPKAVRKRRMTKRMTAVRWIVPVTESTRSHDPLVRQERPGRGPRMAAAYLLGAVLFHVGAAVLLIAVGSGPSDRKRIVTPKNVLVELAPPAQPEPEPEPEPVSDPPMEDTIPEPQVAPAPKPEPVRKTPRVKTPKASPAREIAADPVDVPEMPSDAPPPRKVVGISFESTVKGGAGPALAVGNTRMGETGARATDPSTVKPAGASPYRGSGTASKNRVAAVIPTDKITVIKPKRKAAVSPEYPSVLKAQGIEGDVAVLIRIDAEGRVTDARVVKGSGQPAFDKAALVAAKKERFSPALRNGEAVEYTLKYTYRFRVTG